MNLGDQIKIRVPNSYKYSYHAKMVLVGKITKINKKSYEVSVHFGNGDFLCVLVDRKEYKPDEIAKGR